MANEKLIKLKIIKKCRYQDRHRIPGDIIEVNEEDKKVFVGSGNATEDLKFEVAAPAKKAEAKKP